MNWKLIGTHESSVRRTCTCMNTHLRIVHALVVFSLALSGCATEDVDTVGEGNDAVTATSAFGADPTGKTIATYDDILALVPPGAAWLKLGRFTAYEQHRTCGPSGCSKWRNTTHLDLTTVLPGYPSEDGGGVQEPAYAKSSFDALPLHGDVWFEATPDGSAPAGISLQGAPDPYGNRLFIRCGFAHPVVGFEQSTGPLQLDKQSCTTAVTFLDQVAEWQTGSGPLFDTLWGLEITDTKAEPVDFAGALGYLTTSHLGLVSNQSADEYGQTARIAIWSNFSR